MQFNSSVSRVDPANEKNAKSKIMLDLLYEFLNSN
jgi:hypothetical protein